MALNTTSKSAARLAAVGASALVLALGLASTAASAQCDGGETVVKFAHVTNTDKHPKGIAAQLLSDRVNEEMNGSLCV
jgi:C4-dicarboxylate-binding protein DctP